MNPRIDEAALLAAGAAGPNPPPADRLRAAAEYVLSRTAADQIILFGSAARGEFKAQSDFDFLVVRPAGRPIRSAERADRWTHPETGDSIDVLFENADVASERRWAAGTVHGAIFAEGATVFAAAGYPLVKTVRDDGMKSEDMVKKGLYKRHEAPKMLEEAALYMLHADTAERHEAWGNGCTQLQKSAERSLKCVIVANGSPFSYIHPLGPLWDETEKADGKIPVERDDAALEEISQYAGHKGYHDESRDDPEALYRKFRPIAEGLLKHAQARVPALMAEHEQRRRTAERRPRKP